MRPLEDPSVRTMIETDVEPVDVYDLPLPRAALRTGQVNHLSPTAKSRPARGHEAVSTGEARLFKDLSQTTVDTCLVQTRTSANPKTSKRSQRPKPTTLGPVTYAKPRKTSVQGPFSP